MRPGQIAHQHEQHAALMKNVEDIYPVSPMQEVMLLHTMSRRGNDSLLNQIVFVSNGKFNVAAFEDAWQLVIQRHPMLRTTFIVDKVKAPLQVVRKTVTLKWDVADWRELDADAQRQRLHQYRETDRAAGINPARAPMMRFFLARTAQEGWYFVWTSHHLQMDRWCLDSVLGDVARFYEQLCAGRKPMVATAPSFRRYINWIADQDRAAALRFWRSVLCGFDQPTPVD
ncbi:MAG: hypothetical protein HKO07_02290, partial [Pseudomonadales bacterium]|nr:hypothetical protein [Pseudomonadales bacterium]